MTRCDLPAMSTSAMFLHAGVGCFYFLQSFLPSPSSSFFSKTTHIHSTPSPQFCKESTYFKFQRYKLPKSTSTDSMQLFIWMPFCQFFELSVQIEHLYELNTLAQVNTLKGCTKLQIVKLFSVDKTKHSCIREQLQ